MSRDRKTPDEKALQRFLCERIEMGRNAHGKIAITQSTSGVISLLDLLNGTQPKIMEGDSDWSTHKNLSQDLFGLITPDIVLRSSRAKENRIIIEVKKTSPFTHTELNASQVLRYFLHLLATTDQKSASGIRRAILLAAPESWFKSANAVP